MRRSLRAQAGLLRQALSRPSSSASAAQEHQAVVNAIPAEVAQLVSLRGGMAVLPPDVEAAVAAAAADGNRKAVKRRGQELSHRLRAMSRSKHRGGVYPNLSEQLEAEEAGPDAAAAAARRAQRGKRRQSRSAALDLLTRAAALPVRDAARLPNLGEVLGPLAPVVSAEEAAQAASEAAAAAGRSSIAEGGSLYDTPAALAYAASRLPACYAALHRALGEVAGRLPGWRPASMLDFGAGPGTAVWAAQQVWPQAPLDALAVEPAAAMSWLGHQIQERQREQHDAAAQRGAGTAGGDSVAGSEQPFAAAGEPPVPPPRLRWMYKLPPRYRGAQGRQYELVTAGYVLGELKSDAERRRLVQQLWERTSGVLLLVEPGTPAGAAHIQRARSQLLEAAAQERAAFVEQQQQQGQGQQGQQQVGAHVVAPCPHDGACPMQGRPSWCHFVQRFQRTQLQRAAKARAGVQPRTYQDERFSYVAIARGPRPAAHSAAAQPLVAGSFMPSLEDPQDFLQLPPNMGPRKVPADARPLVMYSDSEGEEAEEGYAEEGSDLDGWWGEGESEGGYMQDSGSNLTDADSEDGSSRPAEAASSSSSDDSSSSSSDEEEGWHSSSSSDSDGEPGAPPLAARAAAGGGGATPADPAAELAVAGLDEATRQLLLDAIADEEDSPEELQRLQRELLASAAAQRQAGAAGEQQGAGAPGGRPVVVLAPLSEATADLLFDGEPLDWEAAEPGAVAAARRASGGWSRVVRTPRKRKGHVVLDLCSAVPAVPERAGMGGDSGSGEGQAPQGVLLRQVVSKAAARREAGGTAAYRLARRLRWGDLWPHHYQRAFRAEEPPAGSGLGGA